MSDARQIERRELILLLAGALLVSLVMHWPLPLHLGSQVPDDLGDPLGQTWQLAWIGHALPHEPGSIFQANIWWPIDHSLATSDILFGYAPVAVLGGSPHAAIVNYDLLFLFAYFLAFVGAYLLARELGVGPAGAAVAGAAFAYAPWRLGHDAHLNLLSSGGIPLSLFLLLRGYRRNSAGTVSAGWLVAAWQLLLGIGLGIQLAYLLLVLGVVAAVCWYRRRPRVTRGVVISTACGIAVLLLVTGFLARPYLEIRDDNPEAARTLNSVSQFSPDVKAYLRTPPGSFLRGTTQLGLNESIPQREAALFPGAAISLLALAGFLAPVYPRRRKIAFAIAILALAVLALGWRPHRHFPQPYKLVFEYLPGWDAARVSSRLNTLTSLGLAMLAAAGAQELVDLSRRWAAGRRRTWGMAIPISVSAVLVAAVLVEGSGFQLRDGGLQSPLLARVPAVPAGQLGAPEPQLHLPFMYTYRAGSEQLYPYWSIEGFPEIVNGWGGFVPRQDDELYEETQRFPDAASVAKLRARGIRTVVLHPDRAFLTEWETAAQRPVKGLPLRREVRGNVVLYHLKPL